MNAVSVIVSTDRTGEDIVECVTSVNEVDARIHELFDEETESIDSVEVPAPHLDFEDCDHVYVLYVLEGHYVVPIYVTDDEDDALETQAERSEELQTEVFLEESTYILSEGEE